MIWRRFLFLCCLTLQVSSLSIESFKAVRSGILSLLSHESPNENKNTDVQQEILSAIQQSKEKAHKQDTAESQTPSPAEDPKPIETILNHRDQSHRNEERSPVVHQSSSIPIPFSSSKSKSSLFDQPLFQNSQKGKESLLDTLFDLNAKEISEGEVYSSNPLSMDNGHAQLGNAIQDFKILPLRTKSKTPTSQKDEPLLLFLDSLRDKAWDQFKNIFFNHSDSLLKNNHNKSELAVNKVLKQVLSMGDKINVLHLLGKEVNPEIRNIFESEIRPLLGESSTSLNVEKILSSGLVDKKFSEPLNKFLTYLAWRSLEHIVQQLLNKISGSTSPIELEEYINKLEKTNPLASKGLQFVLNLTKRREVENFQGRSISRDYGYGHSSHFGFGGFGLSDHGGGGGSYHSIGHGMYVDPYLILAGIGTAALLGFVIYRLLTPADAAGRRKRDVLSGPVLDEKITARVLSLVENAKFSFK